MPADSNCSNIISPFFIPHNNIIIDHSFLSLHHITVHLHICLLASWFKLNAWWKLGKNHSRFINEEKIAARIKADYSFSHWSSEVTALCFVCWWTMCSFGHYSKYLFSFKWIWVKKSTLKSMSITDGLWKSPGGLNWRPLCSVRNS